MSTSKDMAECELRNAQGYPRPHGPTTRPRATVRSGGAPLTSHVDQSVDNSNNKALPWAVLAALFGGLGFGGVVVLCLLRPWETSDRASQAELRAEFAQRLAAVEKDAGDAASISEIWRNRVNKLEAEANANRRR
jgi:hypothetical protein